MSYPYTETGGFRVGRNASLALNATWPFGTLEIHPDRLVLRTLFRDRKSVV
jgi:hypothetical protein